MDFRRCKRVAKTGVDQTLLNRRFILSIHVKFWQSGTMRIGYYTFIVDSAASRVDSQKDSLLPTKTIKIIKWWISSQQFLVAEIMSLVFSRAKKGENLIRPWSLTAMVKVVEDFTWNELELVVGDAMIREGAFSHLKPSAWEFRLVGCWFRLVGLGRLGAESQWKFFGESEMHVSFFLKRSEDDEVNICKLPSVRIFRSKSVAWIFFRLLKNTEKPFLYYLGLFDGDLMWCTKVTKVLTQCWRFGCHLRRLQQGLLADLWSIASWAGGWRKWRITGNQQGGLDDFYAYGSNMWASSAPRWIGIMKMNGFMLRRNIFYNVLYIAVGFCFSVVSTGFIYVWLSCYWSLYIPDMCIVVTIKMDMVSAEQLGCPWFHFPYPER